MAKVGVKGLKFSYAQTNWETNNCNILWRSSQLQQHIHCKHVVKSVRVINITSYWCITAMTNSAITRRDSGSQKTGTIWLMGHYNTMGVCDRQKDIQTSWERHCTVQWDSDTVCVVICLFNPEGMWLWSVIISPGCKQRNPAARSCAHKNDSKTHTCVWQWKRHRTTCKTPQIAWQTDRQTDVSCGYGMYINGWRQSREHQ